MIAMGMCLSWKQIINETFVLLRIFYGEISLKLYAFVIDDLVTVIFYEI